MIESDTEAWIQKRDFIIEKIKKVLNMETNNLRYKKYARFSIIPEKWQVGDFLYATRQG